MIAQKTSELATAAPNLENFMSVFAAGIFFVPPLARNEPFPSAQIFFDLSKIKSKDSYNYV